MRKLLKGIVGLVTIWPLVYMVYFFCMISSRSFGDSDSFDVLMALHGATMGIMLLTLGGYIAHIMTRLPSADRTSWLLIVLLAGPIGAPIYWYSKIWNVPSDDPYDF